MSDKPLPESRDSDTSWPVPDGERPVPNREAESGSGPGSDLWPRRMAILGVGLLGGSVAMAVRRACPTVEVVGMVRSPETRDRALACGAIDRATSDLHEACQGCDVVVVATPVDRIAPLVIEAAAASPRHCLITDVGSTKAGIVAAAASSPIAARKFVAAHPIAGGEKTGVEHATASLFDGRLVVITPFGKLEFLRESTTTALDELDPTPAAELTETAVSFWRLTGARTVLMAAEEHDAHLASTSHVPHLVAAVLTQLVTPESRTLVGTGWLDATRIAAGDPDLWTAIVSENRAAILDQLQRFRGGIDALVQRIAVGDDRELARWLAEAKRVRDQAAPDCSQHPG